MPYPSHLSMLQTLQACTLSTFMVSVPSGLRSPSRPITVNRKRYRETDYPSDQAQSATSLLHAFKFLNAKHHRLHCTVG